MDNVLKDFELLIQENNIVINKTNLPRIEAIPIQMNQLFYNLLNNAIKFSNNTNQPVIDITSKRLMPEEVKIFNDLKSGNYNQIIFTDNGIGFDKQFAEDIFLIFHRLNNTREYSGTGIGLALCKRIVDNHHGKIYANSTENAGASFYIILPVIQSYFL
jgi:two-component system CheB/CheR fusion protein